MLVRDFVHVLNFGTLCVWVWHPCSLLGIARARSACFFPVTSLLKQLTVHTYILTVFEISRSLEMNSKLFLLPVVLVAFLEESLQWYSCPREIRKWQTNYKNWLAWAACDVAATDSYVPLQEISSPPSPFKWELMRKTKMCARVRFLLFFQRPCAPLPYQ